MFRGHVLSAMIYCYNFFEENLISGFMLNWNCLCLLFVEVKWKRKEKPENRVKSTCYFLQCLWFSETIHVYKKKNTQKTVHVQLIQINSTMK